MVARFIYLVLIAALLLTGMGSSCVVGFFVFQCDSDLDCAADEFCDVNGTCVAAQFLNETDTCLVEHDCDLNSNLAVQDPSLQPASSQAVNQQPDQGHDQGEPDQEGEN